MEKPPKEFSSDMTAEQIAEEFSLDVVGGNDRLEPFRELIKQAFLAGYDTALSMVEV